MMKSKLVSRSRASPSGSTGKLKSLYGAWVTETFKLDVTTEVHHLAVNGEGARKGQIRTCIASLYTPLIKYLRAIGFCPLVIYENPDTKTVSYEFQLWSWWTFYSIVVVTSFGCGCLFSVIYNLWTGFQSEFADVLSRQGIYKVPTESLSFVSEFGTRLVPATYPLFSISAILGIVSSTPGILQFLQRWPTFQSEFLDAFPHRRDEDPFSPLKKFRNSTFLIFPMICFVATIIVVVVMIKCEYRKGCMFPQSFFGATTSMAVVTIMIVAGSHSVHLFMYRTLTEVFKQIRIGIQLWMEGETIIIHVVGREEGHIKNAFQGTRSFTKSIKNWKRIISVAKEQVRLTGSSLSLQNVLMIFINFIYLCLGIFFSLSSKTGSVGGSKGYLLLMFSAWGVSLLIIKALVCEKIVEQEKSIITLLRKLDLNEHVPSLIQTNSLIDFINDDPAEIRFWNIFTLNKLFLLQLIGQLSTYLIVLIQFDNMDRDR